MFHHNNRKPHATVIIHPRKIGIILVGFRPLSFPELALEDYLICRTFKKSFNWKMRTSFMRKMSSNNVLNLKLEISPDVPERICGIRSKKFIVDMYSLRLHAFCVLCISLVSHKTRTLVPTE